MSTLVLPDTSRISDAARRQIQTAHDALASRRQTPGTPSGDLAVAYGEVGKLLMAAGFREPAAAAFVNAEALAPDDYRWPYYLGHIHGLNGDPTRAAAAFRRASARQPDDSVSLIWLGRSEIDRGQPAAAEAPFTRALAIDSRSAAASLGLGQVMFETGDYARALQYLERARALDPQAGAVRYLLGLTHRALGHHELAETYLSHPSSEKVSLRDSLMENVDTLLDTPVAFEIRGGQALDRREWATAVAYFRKGIELAPNEPALHHKLGTALAMSGDAAGAIREFEAVARRWPSFARAQYSLGVIMAANGRHREASQRFSAAAKGDPADAQTRLQLARSLQALGRYDEASAHYAAAGGLDPRLADAFFGEAMALVGVGRYGDALRRLEDGLSRFGDRTGFAHAAARLLAAAPEDGLRDGRRALGMVEPLIGQRQPTVPLAETMAMALSEVGRFSEAATWQQQAIDRARAEGFADLLPRMTDNLRLYERGRPCRLPWGRELGYVTLN